MTNASIKEKRKANKKLLESSYPCNLKLDNSHNCNILIKACYSDTETLFYELHQELLKLYENPYAKSIIDFLVDYIKQDLVFEERKPLKIFLTKQMPDFFSIKNNEMLMGSYTFHTSIYLSTGNNDKPYTPNIIMSTLLHETVHLILELLYKNHSSPFPATFEGETPEVETPDSLFVFQVKKEMEQLSKLNDLLQLEDMFILEDILTIDGDSYSPEEYSGESLARTIEALILPNGEKLLETHMPELLAGFKKQVIVPIDNLPRNKKRRNNKEFEEPAAKKFKPNINFSTFWKTYASAEETEFSIDAVTTFLDSLTPPPSNSSTFWNTPVSAEDAVFSIDTVTSFLDSLPPPN